MGFIAEEKHHPTWLVTLQSIISEYRRQTIKMVIIAKATKII